MRRNWMIGMTAALVLVVTFAAGYRTGTGSRAQQMIDAREAGTTFQREWHEGIDKADAERAEKNRLMQEQHDREQVEGKPARLQALKEKLDAIDYRDNPTYKEGMATLPEDQRQKWDDDCRTGWEKAKADAIEQAARE